MKNNNKYKILVLSDLTNNSVNVLKSAARIAQIVDGELEIFHVRKAIKVVEKESNLSAARSIKEHYVTIGKKLQSMATSVREENQITTSHFSAFGNIKKEIENHIENSKPDIVVIGKRVSKMPAFFGDGVVSFLMKKFKGVVVVADNENILDSEAKLNMGLFNSNTTVSNNELINSILATTKSPIHSFEVANSIKGEPEKNQIGTERLVSYVFEKNDNTSHTIHKYMSKHKVNLLVVNRNNSNTNKNFTVSELNDFIYNSKVPIVLFNN
ncbi:universal stress protein [Jejudonia soesokkakensis]|uniref:Universal stress protein n=1 Tax=Jejudonia soesokkakensis TaxID=1323432 RepID=A0ABW2MS21_9FLAO